jgi:hypothetical protein
MMVASAIVASVALHGTLAANLMAASVSEHFEEYTVW